VPSGYLRTASSSCRARNGGRPEASNASLGKDRARCIHFPKSRRPRHGGQRRVRLRRDNRGLSSRAPLTRVWPARKCMQGRSSDLWCEGRGESRIASTAAPIRSQWSGTPVREPRKAPRGGRGTRRWRGVIMQAATYRHPGCPRPPPYRGATAVRILARRSGKL